MLTAASLRADEGTVCALLGRNGAGKSTLLNIAAGVLAPDHRLIVWGDQRLQRANTWRLARDGGERRRAEIAAALVRRPTCLFADEVFLGLAPLDAELIGTTIREIAADGCAVVITGHEIPFLMRYADRITWCTSGTTLELGSPELAKSHDAFRTAYLGEQW